MTKLSDTVLSLVAGLVAARLGLDFRKRGYDLERGIRAAVREQEHPDLDGYIQKLLSGGQGSAELELLASHLTVGETYFFRDRRALEILAKKILPEWAKTQSSRSELNIWSAGCSTGEEPYSIAIALDRMAPRSRNHNIEIFGTDINPHALEKAAQGIYGEWSFRDTPPWVRNTYFQDGPDNRWSILARTQRAVTFHTHNLLADSYPFLGGQNPVDVIFCRNVLMYFTSDAMREVAHRFHRLLAPDGWLVVSPAEASCDLFSEFVTVSVEGVTLYRKRAPLQVVVPADTGHDEPADISWRESTAPSLEPAIAENDFAHQFADIPPDDFGRQPDPDLRKGPGPEETALDLARACANEGKLTEALCWCEKAIAADKMAATAHYLKATILQEQGLVPESLASLRQAVYSEPGFVLGHFALGNLALRQGKLKESQKHFANVRLLLAQYGAEDIVPESDGLSAGMLRATLPRQTTRVPKPTLHSSTEQVTTR